MTIFIKNSPKKYIKAWVNFNGTGVVSINECEGVDSITDLGTGNYRVNLTSGVMPDANYAVSFLGTQSSSGTGLVTGVANSTILNQSDFTFKCTGSSNNIAIDATTVALIFVR